MRGTLQTFSPQHSVYDAAALALIAGQFKGISDEKQAAPVLTALNKIITEKTGGTPLASIQELSRFPYEQQERFLSEALENVLKAPAPDVKVESNKTDEKIAEDLLARFGIEFHIKKVKEDEKAALPVRSSVASAAPSGIRIIKQGNEWRVSLPKDRHEEIIAARYSRHYGLVRSFSLSQPPQPPAANKIYLQVREEKGSAVDVTYHDGRQAQTIEIDVNAVHGLSACLQKNKPLELTHLQPFFSEFSRNIPPLAEYQSVVKNIRDAKADSKRDTKEEDFSAVVKQAAYKEIATRLGIDEKHSADAQAAFIKQVAKSNAPAGSEAEMVAIGEAAAEYSISKKRKEYRYPADMPDYSSQEYTLTTQQDKAKLRKETKDTATSDLKLAERELSAATQAIEVAKQQEQTAADTKEEGQRVLAQHEASKQKEIAVKAEEKLSTAQRKLDKIKAEEEAAAAKTQRFQKWRQAQGAQRHLFGRFADEKSFKSAFAKLFAMVARKKGGCLYVNAEDLTAISDKLLVAKKIMKPLSAVWKTRAEDWKQKAPKEMKLVLDAVDTDHTLTPKGMYSGKVVFNKDKATVDFTCYKNGSLLLSTDSKTLEHAAKLAFAQMQKNNNGRPVTSITLSHIDPFGRRAEVHAAFKAAGFKRVNIEAAKVAEEKEEKHAEDANWSLLRL